jgi:hypothetical protein
MKTNTAPLLTQVWHRYPGEEWAKYMGLANKSGAALQARWCQEENPWDTVITLPEGEQPA